MKDIYVRNDIIKSVDCLSVYCAVSYLSNSSCDTVMFNADMVAYVLYGTMDIGRRQSDGIKKSISSLTECGVFELMDEFKGTYIVNNVFTVDGCNGKFTTFTLDELRRLYSVDFKNKDGLLQYYLYLLSTINHTKKCGWNTMDSISYSLNLSKRDTVISYNVLLEDAKLIYIHRNNATIKVGEEYQRVNNVYGRYEDRHVISKYGDEWVDNFNSTSNVADINSRSISKNYNDFLKGRYKGDVDKLKQDCIMYNEKYKDSVDVKQKDLSVFDNVDCVIEEVDSKQRFKDWFDDIYKHSDNSFNNKLAKELVRLFDGKKFTDLDDKDAEYVHKRMIVWVQNNKVGEELLPY